MENNALCSTVTCLNNPLDMSKPVMGGAGIAAAEAGAAAGAAIADALNGDKDGESAPNVGANLRLSIAYQMEEVFATTVMAHSQAFWTPRDNIDE